jgi:hypothetical protein
MRSSLEGLQTYYERQFVEEGPAILFRAKGTGPAYRVSADERKSYLEEMSSAAQRARLWLTRIMMTGMLATVSILVATNRGVDQVGIYLGVGLSVFAGMVAWFRVLGVPKARMNHRLVGRLPVKPALNRDETRKVTLSRISYVQLALAPLLSLLLLLKFGVNPFSGSGRWLWLLPASFTLLAGIQAFRKWRYS